MTDLCGRDGLLAALDAVEPVAVMVLAVIQMDLIILEAAGDDAGLGSLER